MSWTSPPTFVAGTGLTAANLNILGADLSFLAGAQASTVPTGESTTTTGSFVALTTPGPSVTLPTGTRALVLLQATMNNNTSNDWCSMSFSVTGGGGVAASAANSIASPSNLAANAVTRMGGFIPISGLTAATITVTALYQAGNGGTATFTNRNIAVIPLP